MALVNDAKREINAKIVYIGPKGAGKDTALRYLYSRIRPENRSELRCMTSGEHSMLFFDFSPSRQNQTGNYSIRFHVYTIISAEGTVPPWKMLLKGADGVVFLADSTEGRLFANLQCCAQLVDAFAHYGMRSEAVPLSLQCNKRDLPGAMTLARLKSELFPEIASEAVGVTALTGDGLLDGLDQLVRQILVNLDQGSTVDFAQETARGTETADAMPPEQAHCSDPRTAFSVESAGEPQTDVDGSVIIPLRLTGGECGKSIDFKVTVSITL